MTEQEKDAFLASFAGAYDLRSAAEQAGITLEEACGVLAADGVRERLDEQIFALRRGRMLARIMREYERMAFGGSEGEKPADRLRVLELLRQMASAEEKESAEDDVPVVIIRCEYV